jgi:hypothetical protein
LSGVTRCLTTARSAAGHRVLAPEDANVVCELKILDALAGAEPASIIAEIDSAIAARRPWERFAEVRVSAGPTVCIKASQAGYEAPVTWGCQHGDLMARDLRSAIECADRLADGFYQMQDAKMIQDRAARRPPTCCQRPPTANRRPPAREHPAKKPADKVATRHHRPAARPAADECVL